MALMKTDAAVTDNHSAGRFELHVDGELRSFATYRDRDGVLVVPHVETVRDHRGNGFAEHLMDGVVENLRQTGRQIDPICPFATDYLRVRPPNFRVGTTRDVGGERNSDRMWAGNGICEEVG